VERNHQFKQAVILTVVLSFVLTACGADITTPMLVLSESPAHNTITPVPTRTLTKAPLELQYTYDLPAWMAEPTTDILATLMITVDGSHKLSFLNAATTEWFDLEIPAGVNYYFWFDNMHFGFLADDMQVMYLLNLSSGQTLSTQVSENATRLLPSHQPLSFLEIKQDPLSMNDFIFEYSAPWLSSGFSIDTRYFAERDQSQDENQVIVTEIQT